MTRVRVAFRYGDRRLFARLVCWLRGGDSAHCEVASVWTETGLHHCVSSSWLDGGVRGKWMPLPADKWRVYEIEATTDPLAWLAEHRDQGYDRLGLLGILWPRLGHSRRRWFCSETAGDVVGLPEPQIFDLRTLESVCQRFGTRVQ